MDYDHYQQPSPSSFRQKLKSSICNYSCCFLNHNQFSSRVELLVQPVEKSPVDHPHQDRHHGTKNSPPSSPSSWIKSRANDFVSEEIKEKWLNLLNRIGRHGCRKGNNYCGSSVFSYDPLSYALNFDDNDGTRFDEHPHFRDFSARLPRSPPPKADKNRLQTSIVASMPRQVAAWS